MKTTRKKSKYGTSPNNSHMCNRKFERELPRLHRKLSRLDVEKDVTNVKKEIIIKAENKPYFTKIANELFGPLDSYSKELDVIEAEIDTYTHFPVQYNNAKLYSMNSKKEITITLIPEHITYAIQDSGVAPNLLKKTIQYVITPGSYLDPCARSWSDIAKPFGFSVKLTQDDFAYLQLPVSELQTKFNPISGECIAYITIGSKTITAQFNKEFNPINKDAEFYFDSGNSKKNNWFIDVALNRTLRDDTIARSLIVCKEMGDTLQAYYGKLFMNTLNGYNQKSVCLFTCDKLLVRRCQLIKIPVIYTTAYRQNDKYMLSIYEVPNIMSLAIEMFEYYKKYTTDTNKSNSNSIIKLINQGWYYTQSKQKITISTQLKQELLTVCKLIHERTNAALLVSLNSMTLEEYRLFANTYKAVEIIDEMQNTFYTLPDYLFVHKFTTDQPILATIKRLLMVGGSHEEKFVYDMSKEHADFRNLEKLKPGVENLFEHFQPHSVMLYDIFNGLKRIYPEKTDDELCYITSDVYSIMHFYYSYTGELRYSDEYIQCILEILKRPEWPDYKEYLEFHNSFAKSESEKLPYVDVSVYVKNLEHAASALLTHNEYVETSKPHTRKHSMVKARRTYKRRKNRPLLCNLKGGIC